MHAAAHPARHSRENLQGRQDRVDGPPFDDASSTEAVAAVRSPAASTRRRRPAPWRHARSRSGRSEQLGGLNAFAGALLRAAEAPRRSRDRPGPRASPAAARRLPSRARHGRPRPSAAGCRRPGADPAATAHRAASRRRGGRRPEAPRARLRPALALQISPRRPRDRLGRDAGEVVALAPRKHGDRNLVRLGGGEEELDVRRRLFQRLQEGVEGPGREHVHFVDVVDLVTEPGWAAARRSAAARAPARRRCCWPRRSR